MVTARASLEPGSASSSRDSAADAQARSICKHCGLPVPSERQDPFCCSGCAAVYALIQGEGLGRFYDLGGSPGLAVGRPPEPNRHDWLEDLEQRGHRAEGLNEVSIDLQGIRCAACVWLLQELWNRRPGALKIEINPTLGRARLSYDPSRLDLSDYLDSCERLGYPAGPPGKNSKARDQTLLRSLGICTALALNAMMFALARYLGLADQGGSLDRLFELLSFGLATLALLIGGPLFFRAAISGLRQRVLHLDLPISLGILLAYGSSTLAFFGSGLGSETYFDTVTVFIALMLVGRYLQCRAIQRNRDYLLANDGAEHFQARVLRRDGLQRVPIRELVSGDRLQLAPGDLLPVDAKLSDQAACFSLDWISGESEPRCFAAGDQVPAGAFLSDRMNARLIAVASAEQSGLLELLSAPSGNREEMRGKGRFWLMLNRIYIALVLGLAACAAIIWWFIDPSRIVAITTSVLVVTCPCALGLATPLAFDLALARLRKHGVYVRSVALLEKVRALKHLILDKTGTLTWGDLHAEGLRPPSQSLRDILLTMAQSSNHPVSRAVAEANKGARFLPDLHVEDITGQGLMAEHEGQVYRLGSGSFTLGDKPGDTDLVDGLCTFTRNGHVEACFKIDEDYRPGSEEELSALAAKGMQIYLCSGDRKAKVARAAERLGIDKDHVFAEMSPNDKAALINKLDMGDTLMVGDGLNDAPAFDAAFCAGTPAVDRPVMPSRADFFYTGGGIAAIRWVILMGHLFHDVVTTNLWLAGAYNVVALSLCFAGMMTPLLCAVLMPLSSTLLIAHTALRIRNADMEKGGLT